MDIAGKWDIRMWMQCVLLIITLQKAGKSAMTKIEDWKALVRNWERQDNDQRQGMAAKDRRPLRRSPQTVSQTLSSVSMTMIQCFSGNGRKKRRSEKMEDVENTRRPEEMDLSGKSYYLDVSLEEAENNIHACLRDAARNVIATGIISK